MTESVYYLYLLQCDSDILYTGIALNPAQRLKQHQSKKPPGAKFTRRFKHIELVYHVSVGSRSKAQNLEYHVKSLSKKNKTQIIEQQFSLSELRHFMGIKDA